MQHRGWVCAFWLVLFGRAFSGSFFGFVLSVVLFVVRAFGRSFWSFFLVVLFVVRSSVRAFGRSSSGSCFLGARMCFLFDALKFLEACVARSEVS